YWLWYQCQSHLTY
ncbi:ribonuclease, Rne/Rng family domain protein, partial [Vibrio parahaemolyticus VP2007-007]